jgi:YrbI family 3-deoxy-D-manno-octulosonate 8-phosphate phosphatase
LPQNNNCDLEWFKTSIKDINLTNKIKNIKIIISDVDGALTDGKIEYDAEGQVTKRFSTLDGFGMTQAMQAGLKIALVSGNDSPATLRRAKKLKIPESLCFIGVKEKTSSIKLIAEKLKINTSEVLVWGDDFLDLQIKMKYKEVFFVTPINSPFYIQKMSDLTIPKHGGNDSFRLLLDFILFIQKRHFIQNTIENLLI